MGGLAFFDELGIPVSASPDTVHPLSELSVFQAMLSDYEENGADASWMEWKGFGLGCG